MIIKQLYNQQLVLLCECICLRSLIAFMLDRSPESFHCTALSPGPQGVILSLSQSASSCSVNMDILSYSVLQWYSNNPVVCLFAEHKNETFSNLKISFSVAQIFIITTFLLMLESWLVITSSVIKTSCLLLIFSLMNRRNSSSVPSACGNTHTKT